MSADSMRAARLVAMLPLEVRGPFVAALRALAQVFRRRAPQDFAPPSG
ncbi:MAG TPA: hypothetical protein VK459_01770 [Polyangiaceae bacterium]|nr:hypothetical protein [Polyangiaceae bacterium]